MKTAATYLLAFLFIFLLCPDNSAAQDIEGELKTYAALCDSCLMLKKSLSEGAAVSPDKAKSLIGKLWKLICYHNKWSSRIFFSWNCKVFWFEFIH